MSEDNGPLSRYEAKRRATMDFWWSGIGCESNTLSK